MKNNTASDTNRNFRTLFAPTKIAIVLFKRKSHTANAVWLSLYFDGYRKERLFVSFSRNLLNSILIFMSYSLVMSIIWILLESPDLAITEAAVGAGVTSLLFFVTLKKIHAMQEEGEADE